MDYSSVKAIIMAGDGHDSKRLEYDDCVNGRSICNTCFIPVNGRSSLERTVDTLDSLGIKDRHITTNPDYHEAAKAIDPSAAVYPCSADSFIESAFFIRDNIPVGDDEYCLVVFGDTPFTTSRAVSGFLDICSDHDADLYHAIVPKESLDFFNEVFPRKRYVPTRDLHFRVSNLTYGKPHSLDYGNLQSAAEVKAQKKFLNRLKGLYSSLRIGKHSIIRPLLNLTLAYEFEKNGRPLLSKVFRDNVPLSRVEDAVSAFFGAEVRLPALPYAEITFDIDDEAQELDWLVQNEEEISKLISLEHEFLDTIGDVITKVTGILGDEYREHPVTKRLLSDYARGASFLANIGVLRHQDGLPKSKR